MEGMGTVQQQIRSTMRKLARAPLFTTVAIVTLAVGVGATTAVFTVVDRVLLRPLPFHEPERLVSVWLTAPGFGFDRLPQATGTYFTFREEGRAFEEVGLWNPITASVTGLAVPERVEAMQVTDGTLPLLGVAPALGRGFTPEDDTPDAPPTVILGNGFWVRRFGGDRGVLGSMVTVDGVPREIIGVMPPGVRFLDRAPALIVPFRFDRTQAVISNFSYPMVARLRPENTLEEASADVARMLPLSVELFPRGLSIEQLEEAGIGPNLMMLREELVGGVNQALWVLLGAVGIVLLIACANVANLFLVRAESRQLEVTIRAALGAGRRRIAGDFVSEGLSLGLLSGLAGLGLAVAGVHLLLALSPEGLPRLEEISVGWTSLGVAVAVSVLAGVILGLLPAFRSGLGELAPALREGGRGSTGSRRQQRARSALAVSQIALALVLLVGSGLMIQSFRALLAVDPGFERPEEVLTFRVALPSAEAPDGAARARVYEDILFQLREIPDVSAAALSSSIPMDGWNDSGRGVYFEDFPVSGGQMPPVTQVKWVSPDYFETLGRRVVAGRMFSWTEQRERLPVVVVTESFAREYWGDPAGVVGRRLRVQEAGPFREIVGVVGNVYDDGIDQGPKSFVYMPMVLANFGGEEVYARGSMVYSLRLGRVAPAGMLDRVREAVSEVNPNLPLASARTLEEFRRDSMARTSFMLVMLGIAAAVALLLGAVGIYGVLAYSVSQRSREIGVRMALGANRTDVSRMVVYGGLSLTGIGIGVGFVAALAVTRLMGALLYGVSPFDPATFAIVSVVVGAIAFASSYLPARRAASVDPMGIIRQE